MFRKANLKASCIFLTLKIKQNIDYEAAGPENKNNPQQKWAEHKISIHLSLSSCDQCYSQCCAIEEPGL